MKILDEREIQGEVDLEIYKIDVHFVKRFELKTIKLSSLYDVISTETKFTIQFNNGVKQHIFYENETARDTIYRESAELFHKTMWIDETNCKIFLNWLKQFQFTLDKYNLIKLN